MNEVAQGDGLFAVNRWQMANLVFTIWNLDQSENVEVPEEWCTVLAMCWFYIPFFRVSIYTSRVYQSYQFLAEPRTLCQTKASSPRNFRRKT